MLGESEGGQIMVMNVLKQRRWTEEELKAEGFRSYDRKKTVVLARELRPNEAPKRIKTAWDTLVAHAGFMICYDVSDGKKHTALDSYTHWPVEPGIFLKTYRKWDVRTPWKPTAPEKHLLALGCKPYYKHASVWAKKLKTPQWLQSREGIEPILIPSGGWITIGIEGEPTSMTEAEFHERYRLAKR
jgi:hypothetical protein